MDWDPDSAGVHLGLLMLLSVIPLLASCLAACRSTPGQEEEEF